MFVSFYYLLAVLSTTVLLPVSCTIDNCTIDSGVARREGPVHGNRPMVRGRSGRTPRQPRLRWRHPANL